MNIGNIMPGVGIQPTSLVLRDSVLSITPPRLPDVTTVPTPSCLCSSLPERSGQTTTLFTYIDITLGLGSFAKSVEHWSPIREMIKSSQRVIKLIIVSS